MSILASDLCANAMKLIGAMQPGDPIPPQDAADVLTRLNSLLSSWNTERLACFVDVTLNKTYVAGQDTYTVGAGGDLNGQRPDTIEWAWVRQLTSSPPQDVPQAVLSEYEFDRIAQKLVTGTYPSCVWYEPAFPLGKLHVWPVATNTNYQQFIRFKQFLSAGLTLVSSVDLPNGYQEAIEQNLALRIAPLFGKTAVDVAQRNSDPTTGESFAKIALSNVKRVNQTLVNTPQRSDVPSGANGTAFNILTNQPNPPFRGR